MKTFSQFITEIFDKCYPQAVAVLHKARKEGKSAQLLQVAGFRGDTTQAHQKWKTIPAKHWHHYVTRVGDIIHDPTAKQFHPNAEETYHHSKLDTLWDAKYEVEPV